MYATQVTHLDSTSGVTQLNGGDSVSIHSIVVTNTSGSAVTITFTQGSAKGTITTTTLILVVANGDSMPYNPDAIFDKGFRVPALAANTTVTIAWRPGV
jgi:hypothetical protein